MEKNYTVVEAARIIGCGRTKVYDLMKAGKLLYCKIGSRTVIEREQIAAFLDSCRVGA